MNFQLPKNARDLSGQKFNRLTAIYPIGTRTKTLENGTIKSFGVVWHCKCDCGNEHNVLSTRLTNGTVKSCGCLAREVAAEVSCKYKKPRRDLTGERFGKLTVIKRDESPERNKPNLHGQYWLCECDCGSPQKSVFDGHLLSGSIVSCGCEKSMLISQAKKASPHAVHCDEHGLYFISKGHVIRFDEEDLDVVTACLWNVDTLGYCSGLYQGEEIRLHRAIMQKYAQIDGLEIDHRNGVIDDYRKSNLRVATHAENMKNTTVDRKNRRIHKGVSQTNSGTWLATITCDGDVIRLGTFKTFAEACNARDEAELHLFGEFSRLTACIEE